MIESPCSYSAALDDGTHLTVMISPSPRGPLVRAEVTAGGQVVGTIEANQIAIERTLGFLQRANQPENRARDQPFRMVDATLPPCLGLAGAPSWGAARPLQGGGTDS